MSHTVVDPDEHTMGLLYDEFFIHDQKVEVKEMKSAVVKLGLDMYRHCRDEFSDFYRHQLVFCVQCMKIACEKTHMYTQSIADHLKALTKKWFPDLNDEDLAMFKRRIYRSYLNRLEVTITGGASE